MNFDIDFKDDEKLLVELKGDLDINTVEDFKKEVVDKYKDLDKDIVFDLKDLEYLDSTGLGAFISVYKEVKNKGRDLHIVNAKPNIEKLFTITELDSLFKIGE